MEQEKVLLTLKFMGEIKEEKLESPSSPDSPDPRPEDGNATSPRENHKALPIIPDSSDSPDPQPGASADENIAPLWRGLSRASWPSVVNTVTFSGASLLRISSPERNSDFLLQHKPMQQRIYHPPAPQPLRDPEERNMYMMRVAPNQLQPLPMAALPLRPLQQRAYGGMISPFRDVPRQGRPISKFPTRPQNQRQAETLKNASNAKVNRRGKLVQKASHLHIAYF